MAEARKGQQGRTARTAEATTIAEGDFIVEHGASVVVRDNGNVEVQDGGNINARYPGGQLLATMGNTDASGAPGVPHSSGMYVFAEEGPAIWWAAQGFDGHTEMIAGGSDNPVGKFSVYTDSAFIRSYGIASLIADGTDFVQVLSVGGDAGIGGGTGTFIKPQSGSGTANVRMDTVTGEITWVSSTERVKTDIQDLEVDPSVVLQLRPRTWLPGPVPRQCPEWVHAQHSGSECHAGEMVDPPADAPREVGFVAEELDALGLVELVEYDGEGLPISIRYDRMTAALVPVVQQQAQQITALQGALAALTERVAALEPQSAEEAP
jgi:hypothetical protein